MSDTEKNDGPKMVTMYNHSGKPVKFADNPANHAAAERAGWKHAEDGLNVDARDVAYNEAIHTKKKDDDGNWGYKKAATPEQIAELEGSDSEGE